MNEAELIQAAKQKPGTVYVGERFTRLIVTARAGSYGRNGRWACRCDCGAETVVTTNNLRRGNTRSCGCLSRDMQAKRFLQMRLEKDTRP